MTTQFGQCGLRRLTVRRLQFGQCGLRRLTVRRLR
jgi:hypothetical protein